MEQEKKNAADVEKEGAKVTGDAAPADQEDDGISQEASKAHATEEASKKEDMTGYNELPEQSKVGGG